MKLFGLLLVAGCLAAQSQELRGTWAVSAGQRTLSGTWTAEPHQDATAATGTWQVRDDSGKRVAEGSWSARKAANEWSGSFQVRVVVGDVYSGTWTAQAPVAPGSGLLDLLRAAIGQMISGAYEAGKDLKGGWSVRTIPGR